VPQHADERDDLRQSPAQDALELPPGVYHVHVHAGARGVDKGPAARQGEVYRHGLAIAQRGQGRHLDRGAGDEGRRVRGMPGREGRGPGNSPQYLREVPKPAVEDELDEN
jgi:hypothetical protein